MQRSWILWGGADGIVKGDGATFDGSQLSLAGGPSDFAAYVDLPNGLISELTDVTFEGWVTIEGVQTWSRVFDFGSSAPGGEDGEVDDVGGGGEGLDYFFLSASRGDNSVQHRVEIRDEDPAGGGVTTIDFDVNQDLPKDAHFTVVYDSDGTPFSGDPLVSVYVDGVLATSGSTNIELGDINDVNNWLGRSNWTNDANFEGSYDEFRIYDYALNQDEVLGNFEAGPDKVNIGVSGDINGDGVCDDKDIDAIALAIRNGETDAKYDLNQDGSVNDDDRVELVKGQDYKFTWIGDSNLDSEFATSDLVDVFQAGQFETGNPATWAQGDWNGDALFTTGDLVAAFQDGGFEKGARVAVAAVPEPVALSLVGSGSLRVLRLAATPEAKTRIIRKIVKCQSESHQAVLLRTASLLKKRF